jgi:uncharacterized protein YdiU (UPF0061 family)
MKDCGFSFETTYTTLPKQFFTEVRADTVISPDVIILNSKLAESLGLNFSGSTKKEQAELFSGNQLPEGSTPFSQAYAGHQFGYFTMLGDGRAHVWGEHITPAGIRFDIQFKGSGRTPYSRSGDGKAALGPMLREYVISEAVHHLGIPTTRSLAVVTTGEPVVRETILPGAILTRVASSHIRVGTFEFAANQLDRKDVELLMNYTIHRHYPDLLESENKALNFIQAVMEKQAELIVNWMRVGFIHGVMNTDNMTMSGEAIDFGPCAFMDNYNPDTVFSSIDHMGRYAFANQAKIAQWNLARLADSIVQFINDDINKAVNLAEEAINQFQDIYKRKWSIMMNSKLGLFDSQIGDDLLVSDLLSWMHKNNADYTNTFLDLSQLNKPTGKLYKEKQFEEWYLRWHNRLRKNTKTLKSSMCLMRSVNPAVIPRNHKVEEALEAANESDFKPFKDLLAALKEPYTNRGFLKPYQTIPKSSGRLYQTFCGT